MYVFICANPGGAGGLAEGHAVVRGAGAPSPPLDTLKGATSLSSYQGSEFYYLTEPASVLHCANSGVKQPSDNNHLTKPSRKNSHHTFNCIALLVYLSSDYQGPLIKSDGGSSE